MGFGDLLLLLWLWGVCVHIWRLTNIDFVTLLKLQGTSLDVANSSHNQYKHVIQPEQIVYRAATDLSLLFLSVFVCFNKIARGAFNQEGNPLVAHYLAVCLMVFLLYRMVVVEHRSLWWSMLWQVIAAPMYAITFRCGYIGDILTSLVRVFVPLALSFAYVYGSIQNYLFADSTQTTTSSSSSAVDQSEAMTRWEEKFVFESIILPFLTLFPLWIRLVQCLRRSVETGKAWPHFGNALKYTSAIAVIAFGTFSPSVRTHTLWIAGFVFATLFQFTWDVFMDWGILVSANSVEADNNASLCGILALRRVRIVGPTYVYVVIAVVNIVLRFAWTLTLLPNNAYSATNVSVVSMLMTHLGPVIAAAEVFRRMIWGILRLEWEQLEAIGPPNTDIVSERVSAVSSDSSSEMSKPFSKVNKKSCTMLLICNIINCC
jgi:hypothetical protein